MQTETTPNEFVELTQNEMSNIYLKLSVSESTNFDYNEKIKFVDKCITEIYDEKFRQILTKDLQENIVLLNNSFVSLLKYCLSKQFKEVSIIFLAYCDYFDLDLNKTFTSFHEKIQNLIKQNSRKVIDDSIYKKYNKVSNKNTFNTLFDLVKNKK